MARVSRHRREGGGGRHRWNHVADPGQLRGPG